MEYIDHCKKCNKKGVPKTTGFNSGLYCATCNEWLVVTTCFPDIVADDTEYTLQIAFSALPDVKQLKLLSKKLNLNFLQLKQKADKNEHVIYQGKANELMDIIKIIRQLKGLGVEYTINPYFPYEHLSR